MKKMKSCDFTIRVRYQETDQMGIVYYSNYFVYFEMGRIELLRNLGISYSQLEKENIFLAVVDAQCKYRSPARFDDLLVVNTCISKLKYTRVEFCYKIRHIDEEKLIAEGSTMLACLDANRKPLIIPDKVVKAIDSHNSPPVTDLV
ncbi:MAG: acyl-CoA thioesterase [Candidatus Scalindua sp.]|nr:acyl-CoA thioesterase [Candidatus Scalindua sp.]